MQTETEQNQNQPHSQDSKNSIPSVKVGNGCLTSEVLETTENPRLLFCVAYEIRTEKNTWKAGLEYMHAASVGDALMHFGGTFMAQKGSSNYGRVMGLDVKLVGIAPVIGAHAVDDNADKLII